MPDLIIKLPDYKKIAESFRRKKIEVKQGEVDKTLLWLQKTRIKKIPTERPSKKGDFLEIEYTMISPRLEGPFRDGFLLGKAKLVPGFEDNLVGMEPGQEREFKVVFPKEYFDKDLAGKEAKFKVKLINCQAVKEPKLDDDFAKELGNFNNLKELKDSIKEGIEKEKQLAESARLRKEILEKIINETQAEIPEIVIEKERERMLKETKKMAESLFKISFSQYLEKIKKTEKELKESLTESAQKRIKAFLVLNQIAKEHQIEANQEEIEKELNKFLAQSSNREQLIKELDLEQLKSYIKENIIYEKTLVWLENFVLPEN